MKKLILSLAIIAGGFMTTQAQEQKIAPAADNAVAQAEPQKKQITEAQLPDAVKTVLATDENKEWKLASAWQVVEGANEYYILEMDKGEERKTLKLNKEGQLI